MATALLKEIESVQDLVQARNRAGASLADTFMSSLADGLISQINNSPAMKPEDATSLTQALNESPYGQALTKKILHAIDTRAQAAMESQIKCKHRLTKGQRLLTFYNYCTQQDWDLFNNKKKPMHMKMTAVADRLANCGVMRPSEETLKWILAILLVTHYDALPSYQEIYGHLQDLKSAVSTARKPWPHQVHMQYPKKPQDLGEAIFAEVYNAENPPIAVDLEGLSNIAENHIPLRENSKLLIANGKKSRIQDKVWAMLKETASSINGNKPIEQIVRRRAQPTLEAIICDSDEHESQTVVPHCWQKTQVPDFADSEEEALWFEYRAKLLRKQMQAKRASSSAVGEPKLKKPRPDVDECSQTQDGSLPMSCVNQEDGGLLVISRAPLPLQDQQTEGASTDAGSGAEPKKPNAPKSEASKDDKDNDNEGDLDSFAKAALAALGSRNTKKKDAAKKQAMMKRPAARQAAQEVAKKDITSALPVVPKGGGNPPPVRYNGGVVYSSLKTKSFRTLRIVGDPYSEKNVKWGANTPTMKAWRTSIKVIDDARKDENP